MITARSAPNDAAAAPTSVEGTTPGPRAGAAASDDEAGEDEVGGGEAGVEGQSQRRRAPRGLGAEAAEAGAGDMDVAEALEDGAESAADPNSQPRPVDWGAMTRNQKTRWRKTQNRKHHTGPGSKGAYSP